MNHPTLTELRHAIAEGDTDAAMAHIARLERDLASVTERQVLYAHDALEECFGRFLTNDLSSLDGDEPPEALLHETFRFVRDLRGITRTLEGQLLQANPPREEPAEPSGLWIVGDNETGRRLGIFTSHDNAARFIGGLPGHEDGHYYLDGPCPDLIVRDPSED